MSHDDLQAALETLSQAHGSQALAAAFRLVQRTVRRARAGDGEVGRLARSVREAIAIRDQMNATGVTGPELDAGLELVLRDTWPAPKGRTEPWHDICSSCRDYGLVMATCSGDATCGPNTHTGRPRIAHGPHDFGVPCWCNRGLRFTKKAPTDFDAVDRAAKPKPQMQRFVR
jgi:hypothetical protein